LSKRSKTKLGFAKFNLSTCFPWCKNSRKFHHPLGTEIFRHVLNKRYKKSRKFSHPPGKKIFRHVFSSMKKQKPDIRISKYPGFRVFRLTCDYRRIWEAFLKASATPRVTDSRRSRSACSRSLRWSFKYRMTPLAPSEVLETRQIPF